MVDQAFLDSVFKRDDIRGYCPDPLGGEAAMAIGRALARLAAVRLGRAPRLVVGYDAREYSPLLAAGVARGAQAAGGEIFSAGCCPTEIVYYLCGSPRENLDGGIMITASHNPKEYNGMKFIWRGAVPLAPAELQELGRQMLRDSQEPLPDMPETIPPARDCREELAASMLQLADCDHWSAEKIPLRVVVEAGHGAGGIVIPQIAKALESRGCQMIVLHGEPDGRFPNGVPNPLLPEWQERLCAQVLEHHADLGIIFDGDTDRAGIATNGGKMLSGSQVLCLLAMAKLKNHRPQDGKRPLVGKNLCCSRLLEEVLEADGNCQILQTPVGHGVIKRMMRSPRWSSRLLLAGEHSGHFYYPEFNCADSGLLTALYMISCARTLKAEGRSLESLASAWRRKYRESGEINRRLASREELFGALSRAWKYLSSLGGRRLEVAAEPDDGTPRIVTAEGEYEPSKLATPDLKVILPPGHAGQCIIRPSGNEPMLRLFLETEDWPQEEYEQLLQTLLLCLQG